MPTKGRLRRPCAYLIHVLHFCFLSYSPFLFLSRRAALEAHPDKGGSEAKMAVVNEAYEVLSNPELRQRFDNGDDPNDPMQGQGGPSPGGSGGHPFAHFFQQAAGSGGFQFRAGGGGPGSFSFNFHGGRH